MSKGKEKQRQRKLTQKQRWSKRPIKPRQYADNDGFMGGLEADVIAASLGSLLARKSR